MKTAILKKELHNAIDSITDNSLLEAVYVLLNKNVHEYSLSKAQEKELKHRLELIDKAEESFTPYKKSIKSIRQKLKGK
jgi:predicted house-cleaning noncanonical NTP pyrophosphatase (MazG superfamily)